MAHRLHTLLKEMRALLTGLRDRLTRDDLNNLLRDETGQEARSQHSRSEVTNAEHVVALRVALTATQLSRQASIRLSRRMQELRAAQGRIPRLDGELLKAARGLFIQESKAARSSGAELHRRQPRMTGMARPLALWLIVGLEAVFIATFVYANIKQGRSWLSLDGAVSILVGLAHPVVIALTAQWVEVAWAHEARSDADTRRRRVVTAAAAFVLALDCTVVWHLTSFIFHHALTGVGAVTSGLNTAGFPVWVMALLFTLLPVAVIVSAAVAADPAVAQFAAVRTDHQAALDESSRQEKAYKQAVEDLSSSWLALHAICVDLGRQLQLVVLTGEHTLLTNRSTTGYAGLWSPANSTALSDEEVEPSTGRYRDAVVTNRAQLDRIVLPAITLLRNVALSGAPRVLLQDLEQAVRLLQVVRVPDAAEVHQFLDAQLGGASAVEDPIAWKPFALTGPALPPEANAVSGPALRREDQAEPHPTSSPASEPISLNGYAR
jgi:hypothetical protein